MNRYRMELNGGEPWPEPDLQGLWVLHEDAEAAVQAEREACKTLCVAVRTEGSDCKEYEKYDDGFVDGCNECEWAIGRRSNV